MVVQCLSKCRPSLITDFSVPRRFIFSSCFD